MANIIKGTTPTIQYTFKTVDVSIITVAILTIKQGGTVVIEKTLEAAVVGESKISWRLTQEETLALLVGTVTMMLNWVTSDGTRGASAKDMVVIEGNHIEEVI